MSLERFKKIVVIALYVVSATMFLEGIQLYLRTSGSVVWSEFGVLVAIAHQISLIVIWLALFLVWKLLPDRQL